MGIHRTLRTVPTPARQHIHSSTAALVRVQFQRRASVRTHPRRPGPDGILDLGGAQTLATAIAVAAARPHHEKLLNSDGQRAHYWHRSRRSLRDLR